MSNQFKISKERLAEIIKEEYASILAEENKKKKEKFPDLTGDGEVTQADILKARGVDLDDKDSDEEEDKKVKKESLDSIRDLIAQELSKL